MFFFELTRHYKNVFKPLQRDSEDNVQFSDTHSGHKFSHSKKSKHPTIPRIALPKGKLCPIKDLQLNINKPTEESLDKQEMYAKMALLMFYHFQCLDGLKVNGSYWEKFTQELHCHLDNKST
jgi:hypothetical protein